MKEILSRTQERRTWGKRNKDLIMLCCETFIKNAERLQDNSNSLLWICFMKNMKNTTANKPWLIACANSGWSWKWNEKEENVFSKSWIQSEDLTEKEKHIQEGRCLFSRGCKQVLIGKYSCNDCDECRDFVRAIRKMFLSLFSHRRLKYYVKF